MWLYIALNRTPNIDCYWLGPVPNVRCSLVCTSTHTHIYIYIYMCIYVYTYIRIKICTHMYTHMFKSLETKGFRARTRGL